ncbi:MAG: ATP-binding cassette domain-containing protein [Firmicutes bacterium]|nr:ATP-binding cassette domain-containing protein [Bacillota bacterium]
MIEIKNLSKIYNTDHGEFKAIENINITINDGDIFGIIGMSGAGKSTLLRCINLLERPTSGQILIDGKDITSFSGKQLLELRKNIGMVFQKFNLLMQRTVSDNVAYPLEICGVPKAEREKRVKELLELVDLSSKANNYPVQLSGGQQQRVSIARALANNSPIILCDEPTSALDSLTTNSLLQLLKDINSKLGVTIIIITHEMSVVNKICNRVAVIDDSHIIEQGDTKDVFENPKEEMTKLLLTDMLGMERGAE